MTLLPTSCMAKAIVAAPAIALPTQRPTIANLLILPHFYALVVVKEALTYLKIALYSIIIIPIKTNLDRKSVV